MPWFMVDDQLAMNKKVAEAGNAAMGLWVRAGSWSQRELTGGFVPKHVARSLGTAGQAKALVTAGLWLPLKDGYSFHDWDRHQMSVEELKDRKRKRAEAGRLGGQASGESRRAASAEANASPSAGLDVEQKRTPVPVLVPSGVTSGGRVTEVDATGPRPECPDHEENSDGKCRPCMRRRKWDEAQAELTERTQLEEKRRQKEARENCPRCEGTCTYIDETGQTRKCVPHQVRIVENLAAGGEFNA